MVLRVTGLASGMNIDEIVENMIKADSIPLNEMKQDQTLLEWKRDAYREVNTSILNFRNTISDMKYTSYYRTRTVTSSNESVVSATAANGAAQGSYTIKNVSQLATAASYVSGNIISGTDKDIDLTDSLSSLNSSFTNAITWTSGSVHSDTLTYSDGESLKIDLSDGTKIINTADMTVKVNGETYNVVTSGDPAEDEVYVDVSTGELTFNSGVTFDEDDTITADYVTDSYVKTQTVSAGSTSLSLDKTRYQDSGTTFEITIGDLTLTEENGNIVDGDNNQVGTIDENGKITFTDSSLFQSDTEVTIKYQEQYADFEMTTQTSEGEQYQKFLFQSTDSLNTVFNDVNSSDLGVTMFYDSYTGKISLTRTETGDYNSDSTDIVVNGDLKNVLGFNTEDADNPATYQEGTNASFEINGLTTTRPTNTFTINGVSITLKDTISDTSSGVTLVVANDTDKMIENIKSFVDAYNSLISTIESELDEEKYDDYLPLTDDEREELTDTQQEEWEEKAKSGLLYNDSTLSSFITKARTMIYTSVKQSGIDSAYSNLASIGITTTSDYTSAKLEIDEDKLREAIEADPESVELIFRSSGDTTSEQGVVNRLYDVASSTMDTIYSRAGKSSYTNDQFTIGQQLDDLDDKIEAFEDRLEDLEDRYYAQFTQMEQAIQEANSQSSYLSSLLSS